MIQSYYNYQPNKNILVVTYYKTVYIYMLAVQPVESGINQEINGIEKCFFLMKLSVNF